MVRIAILTNLLAYSIVASQPLFYALALGRAQRALSGAAYVELRQRIDAVMKRRVPVLYPLALVTTLALVALAWRSRDGSVLVTAAFALVCLLVDAALMLRENVPLNEVIDRWSPADPPADWESYRSRWFAIFGYRQAVLLLGFVGLLAGAVFRS